MTFLFPYRTGGRPRNRGVALVIVLAFVVLLTALILTYFTRSMLYLKMSDSSLSSARTRQLGQSALEVIVADLRKEIINGSSATTFGTATIYTPNTYTSAVPMRSGHPPLVSGIDPIPNLIRRSVRDDTIAYPGVSSRASAVNSATDKSVNGRFISPARWNKHYLIPRSDMGTAVDTTPNASANFTAPDWVYVTHTGPSVITSPSTSATGRYAYAIYDEGGLLDMNVSGYPSSTPASTTPHPAPNPLNLSNWGYADKGALAFADLTVLGIMPDPVEAKKMIDQIVGWRNYATAQPQGTFRNFLFNLTSALRYHDFVRGNTGGFLTVNPVTWNGGVTGQNGTDQAFTSRKTLLELRDSLGFSQDALQYMGTFSRDLEQPSFVPDITPDTGLPTIKSGTLTNHPTFGTGNDAFGLDRDATNSANDINPPLLSARVQAAFTRADGSQAVAGEPLLKKRFPLSRLALLLRTATASKSAGDPIYRHFGIYRNNAANPWQYDHGNPTGIQRLSQISGREPDFFELLKAGIHIGSIAKSSCQGEPNPDITNDATAAYRRAGTASNYQHNRDVLSALQILQIAANIIDQYDTDGFTTRIQFAGDPSETVSGIEDLPYIYQMRERATFPTSLLGKWLFQPVLWNPHDKTGYQSVNSPTNFRMRAETLDAAAGTLHRTGFILQYLDGQNVNGPVMDWDLATPAGVPLTFVVAQDTHFREPTLLAQPNVPSGTYASGNNVDQFFNLPNLHTQIGILAAEYPLQRPKNPPAAQNTYLARINWDAGPNVTPYMAGVNFILEYQDGPNWVPYDEFNSYISGTGRAIFNTAVISNPTQITQLNNAWKDIAPVKAIDNKMFYGRVKADPRTRRWFTATSQFINQIPMLNFNENTYESLRGGTGIGYAGNSVGLWRDQGFDEWADYADGSPGSSGTGKYRGYQYGYWGENSVRDTLQQPNIGTKRFNRDPDGVARRAMGGYATDPTHGGSTSQLTGLPLATDNSASRPLILNRPFRSVAELGYVFRGEPWKNLSFSFPESGDSALLDLFCIYENSSSDAVVAGRVNLNTRQAPVIQAILKDAIMETTNITSAFSQTTALELGQALVARTSSTTPSERKGPLRNRAELVGKWNWYSANPVAKPDLSTDFNPDSYYSGFSSDVGTVPSLKGSPEAIITRKREAALRALADVGTTRTWNLLIDVVAQTGRFSPGASSLARFNVVGEKRFWLHVSIDRLTGKVIDQQLETVSE